MSRTVKSGSGDQSVCGSRRVWWMVLIGRVFLVVVGGYFVSSRLVAASSVTLSLLGLHRSEAAVLASMSGFVFYLGLLIWGFAQQGVMRLAATFALLAGGGQVLAVLLPRVGG